MSDLSGRCFVKRGKSLTPADFAAEELLDSLPDGKELIITMRKSRSPQHHRWFFSLLRQVVDNTDGRWVNEDDLLDDLKLATKHIRKRINGITGEAIIEPKSINFANLDEYAFRDFVKLCCGAIAVATGIDPETLMAETQATQPPMRYSRKRKPLAKTKDAPPTVPSQHRERASASGNGGVPTDAPSERTNCG